MNAFDNVNIAPQSFAYADITGTDRWLTHWIPARTGWTDIGTPTVTTRFKIVGRQCFIQIKIVPSTTVETTAGSSYVTLPVAAKGIGGEGSMVNATTNISVGNCVIDVTNSRIYVPTQGAIGNTLTINAWYEI